MKNNKNKLILILNLIIFVSLFMLSIFSFKDYRSVIEEDILNITKLTSINIYSEIQIELTKPIFVSLTMANDTFLKNWITEDNEHDDKIIRRYLTGIKEKYQYDSIFFVSDITKNYYHHDKILKQISPDDSHDIWYYDLIASNAEYALDVDTDQAAQNEMTIFVNCIVEDDNDNLLGVTGVGVKMSKIRKILERYNKEVDVEVYLISSDGTIQVHSDEHVIEKQNIFDNDDLKLIKEDILSKNNELKIFVPNDKKDTNYLISYYIEELDWYLIVHKDAVILKELITKQIIKMAFIFLAAFLLVCLLTIKIINYYQNKNIKLANTDLLTEINNRNAFDEYLTHALLSADSLKNPLTLAIIDIDDFKIINDTFGHIHGDNILKIVAEYLKSFIRTDDVLARWGGDEFVIIFKCDLTTTKRVFKRIINFNQADNLLLKNSITLSIGLSEYLKGDTTDSLLKRADQALYNAKLNGKNQICSI